MPSRIEITPAGLVFHGAIDHQTVPGLMKKMPPPDSPETELDLSGAEKVDSAGVAMLIHWGTANLPPDQRIRLRGASEKLRHLIDIMHLGSMFELLD